MRYDHSPHIRRSCMLDGLPGTGNQEVGLGGCRRYRCKLEALTEQAVHKNRAGSGTARYPQQLLNKLLLEGLLRRYGWHRVVPGEAHHFLFSLAGLR